MKIFDAPATMDGVKNPLNNCITGILFYHMCVDHYTSSPPFDKLSGGGLLLDT